MTAQLWVTLIQPYREQVDNAGTHNRSPKLLDQERRQQVSKEIVESNSSMCLVNSVEGKERKVF